MGLSVENVSMTFPDSGKVTLQDVSFDVADGEFVCLIGPSGSGKSTVINLIAGLEKPTQGQILLDGQVVKGPGPDRVVMFQEAALFPWLNVSENVKFGLGMLRKSKEEQEATAMKFLKMVQLSDFRDYQVHQLSGGMKQRVALARALALDSKILLMDEPFASLDKQTINLLREEIQTIWMQTRKTVIFITHSVEEALFFGDRIIMLSADPGQVRNIIDVTLPRPRHIESPEFIRLRKELLQMLRIEVEEIAKKEYDAE